MTEKEIHRIELIGTVGLIMCVCGLVVGILAASSITEPDTRTDLVLVVSLVSFSISIIGGGIIYWLEERFYA